MPSKMKYTTSMMQCYNTKMQFQIFTENQHQQNANPPAWSHFLDDVSCVRFVGQTHSLYTLSQVIILACGHAYCEGILETTLKMHFLSQPQLPSFWQYLSKSASTPFLLTTHFLCVVFPRKCYSHGDPTEAYRQWALFTCQTVVTKLPQTWVNLAG